MTWRVIVRMSFNSSNKKQRSRLSSRVKKYLDACGLKSSRMTGTWEGNAVSAADVARQFSKLLELLSDPAQIGSPRVQLDHLWVYIDRVHIPKANSSAT